MYAKPSTKEKPIYYLPAGGRVQPFIVGHSDRWAIFSNLADPHVITLDDVTRGYSGMYAWVEMKAIKPSRSQGDRCKPSNALRGVPGYEFPLEAPLCLSMLRNVVNDTVIVVFERPPMFSETARITAHIPVGLNKCIQICAANSACAGLS